MIAYTKNEDNSINILGGSDRREVLDKLFHGQDFLVSNDEPVVANGKYFLSSSDIEYIEQKKIEDKRTNLARLEADFISAQQELINAIGVARLNNDAELESLLQEEYAELVTSYEAEKKELEG